VSWDVVAKILAGVVAFIIVTALAQALGFMIAWELLN
jgi:hypothetical protein